MDVYETENELVVVMEIAGMRAEGIRVVFEKDTLAISGERWKPALRPKPAFTKWKSITEIFIALFISRFPSRRTRSGRFYRQGFLTVTIPKRKETAPKVVEVNIR